MNPNWNPSSLDIPALARTGATLAQTTALSALARVKAALDEPQDEPPSPKSPSDVPTELPSGGAPASVAWSLRGESRPLRGGAAETWAHLEANAQLPTHCHRCLQPMVWASSIARSFRFVSDEAKAADLDEDLDDDVLVSSRSFDAIALLEDELLMALPIATVHADCANPLESQASPGES